MPHFYTVLFSVCNYEHTPNIQCHEIWNKWIETPQRFAHRPLLRQTGQINEELVFSSV